MSCVGPLTGYLWRFQWFRFLSIKIARHTPKQMARWWAVNTPLLLSLHQLAIDTGDWETARKIAADLRSHPGAWSTL